MPSELLPAQTVVHDPDQQARCMRREVPARREPGPNRLSASLTWFAVDGARAWTCVPGIDPRSIQEVDAGAREIVVQFGQFGPGARETHSGPAT